MREENRSFTAILRLGAVRRAMSVGRLPPDPPLPPGSPSRATYVHPLRSLCIGETAGIAVALHLPRNRAAHSHGSVHAVLNPARHRRAPAAACSTTFSRAFFLEGQLLDSNRYFIILPRRHSHGKSEQPATACSALSAVLYADMVDAHHACCSRALQGILAPGDGTLDGCCTLSWWGDLLDFMTP